MDHEQLLNLNDRLSSSLGAAYVQGWIENDELHVATSDQSKAQEIEEAGAVAEVVDFSSQQLRDAIGEIMSWQSKQEPEIANAIHGYSISAKDGGLILRVDSKHLDQVRQMLEQDQPAGDVQLTFTPSSGIASPAGGVVVKIYTADRGAMPAALQRLRTGRPTAVGCEFPYVGTAW